MRIYGAAGTTTADIPSGSGDALVGYLPVTGGEALQLNIGGMGQGPSPQAGFTAFQGGWNGGGNGAYGPNTASGSGGGGASDIRRCADAASQQPCALSERVVIAAGGGGGGYTFWGGGSGGAQGVNGDGENGANTNTGSGYGATRSAGGAAGSYNSLTATAGVLGQGGNGTGDPAGHGAGGGGGGLYGGGGGAAAAGGGGSSCASVTGACTASNSVLGTAGAAFARVVGGNTGFGMAVITAMPIGVTGAATGITQTAATIAGQVNPMFLASQPTVYYGTSSSSMTSSAQAAGSPAPLAGNTLQSIAAVDLSGLSAGTTYYYKMCAQSVAGNGCGSTMTFTTPPTGVTPPAFANVAATATGSTSVSVTADVTPALQSTPTISATSVTIEFATDLSFTNIVSTSNASPASLPVNDPPTAVTGTGSGLTASTTYYVRIVGSFTVGGTTYPYTSSTVTVTTQAGGGGGGGGGGGSSSGGGTTPAPAPTTAPPVVPSLVPSAPGTSVAQVGGLPVTTTTTQLPLTQAQPGANGTSVSGPGFAVAVSGPAQVPVGAPNVTTVIPGQQTTIGGGGFQPSTAVNVFVLPNTWVGTTYTNAQGVITGGITLPAGMTPGLATLQVTGTLTGGTPLAVSVVVSIAPPVAPVPTTTGVLPQLAPAQTYAMSNGQPVQPVVRPGGNSTVQIALLPAAMDIGASTANGDVLPVTPSGGVLIDSSGVVRVAGQHMSPGTWVDVFLFSSPTYVGRVQVAPDGSYDGNLPVPAGVPDGEHTMQSLGTTRAGAQMAASIGVELMNAKDAAARAAAIWKQGGGKWNKGSKPGSAGANANGGKHKTKTHELRVLFGPFQAAVSPQAHKDLVKLASKHGHQAKKTVIRGYVQVGGPADNLELAKRRARAVKNVLKSLGVTGEFVIKPKGIAPERNTPDSRRVEVEMTVKR